MTDSVHRRHPHFGGVQRVSEESCRWSSLPAMSGFQNKPEKVATPGDGIPWVNCGHSSDGAETRHSQC